MLWIQKKSINLDINNIKTQEKNGKLYFYHDNIKISPWHDIPLKNGDYYNFVCEIPKWSRAKFEINTNNEYNPIVQDKENGKPRFYNWGDTLFNYGAFPKTWENPKFISEYTKKPGDNDPLDVVEISVGAIKKGAIVPVKVIGIIPLIDSGETDWKILAISKYDKFCKKINNLNDLEKYMPGFLDAITNWLINYKSISKGTINKIATINDKKIGDEKFAEKIIKETHDEWKKL
jgi:inorganic pyrophosphatase